MNELQTLLSKLIAFPSVTPKDNGCQNFIMDYLSQLGFDILQCDNLPVSNFFAQWGTSKPLLLFAGHTDVVAEGNREEWHSDPFVLHERDGMYYGRGTADMKGSLAAMLIAVKKFTTTFPQAQGSLGFLITSGEEGEDYHLGTPYVMNELHKRNTIPQYCIVGEPSSTFHVGDVVKVGRRGSLNAKITVMGKQGHVAYPHLATNPIHTISPALVELTQKKWDEGNAYFPATSLQVTTIKAGGLGNNVIPGEIYLELNIRYSTEQNDEQLKEAVEQCFKRHGLTATIEWRLSGKPFLTSQGKLLESVNAVIEEVTGQKPELSTSGGTSDGRFIAPYGVEIIELGPVNKTIHQINECVSANDLTLLSELFYKICVQLLNFTNLKRG